MSKVTSIPALPGVPKSVSFPSAAYDGRKASRPWEFQQYRLALTDAEPCVRMIFTKLLGLAGLKRASQAGLSPATLSSGL